MHIVIHTDGSFVPKEQGGPVASVGITFRDGDTKTPLGEISKCLFDKQLVGSAAVELEAMRIALEKAKEMGATRVSLFSDCQPLVEVAKRIIEKAETSIRYLHQKQYAFLFTAREDFKRCDFSFIPRGGNHRADLLAFQAARAVLKS